MKVAALYDIHGNLPALESVLHEIHSVGVDQIVIGGDVVPGPFPHETIKVLHKLETPTTFIRGNGEREVLAFLSGKEDSVVPPQFYEGLKWCGQELSEQQKEFLSALPVSTQLEIPGFGIVLFCHATPRSDSEIITRITPANRMLAIMDGVDADTIVCGHTHMQFDRNVAGIRIINAGSVGMAVGCSEAQWILMGPELELRRTRYDKIDAARRILATHYPDAHNFVSRFVESYPAESDLITLYERAANSSAD